MKNLCFFILILLSYLSFFWILYLLLALVYIIFHLKLPEIFDYLNFLTPNCAFYHYIPVPAFIFMMPKLILKNLCGECDNILCMST